MASTFVLVTIMLVALLCHTQADFSPKADRIAQAKIVAQKSIVATQATIQIAKKYTEAPSTKGPAESCIITLVNAIDILNQYLDVLKAFNRGRKADVQALASTAVVDIDECKVTFENPEPAPADMERAMKNTYNFFSSLVKVTDRL